MAQNLTIMRKFYSLLGMRIFITLIIFFSISAQALETDNYLAWTTDIKDSSKKINLFLEQEIKSALAELNSESFSQDCVQVTRHIASRFRARFVHDNPIELWLLKNLEREEFFPHTIDHVEESIYRIPHRFYLPEFGLAPNIRVNGVNFGMDKLTHWSSTGRHYFNVFLIGKKLDDSDLEATLRAIDYGILDELTLHGFWASGVFSFADLEANYQGFLFYKKLCLNKKESYLKQSSSGEWGLIKSPKIEDYVNPDWDETFNTSYLEEKNWRKVSPIIKEAYCPLWNQKKIYDYRKKSFSSKYLNSLSENFEKNVPPRFKQRHDNLCRE